MNLRNCAIWQVAVVVAIAGCATPPPVETRVPVPVPCVAAGGKPVRPALPTRDELLAMDDYRLPVALGLYVVLADPYIAELEAVVDGCARLPTH